MVFVAAVRGIAARHVVVASQARCMSVQYKAPTRDISFVLEE
eukprot:gene5849-9048_t